MMKRAKQTVTAGVRSDSAGSVQNAASPYDMSMDEVPAGWLEAQGASPTSGSDNTAFHGSSRFNAMPTRQESSFIPNIAALGAAFVSGVVWFLIDVQGVYNGPWIAVAVGAFIACAIRLPGIGEGPYKAVLSLSAYLLTMLLVLLFVTHQDLTTVYGGSYSLQDYEETLIRTRFRNLGNMFAYGLGAIVATVLAYLDRPNR